MRGGGGGMRGWGEHSPSRERFSAIVEADMRLKSLYVQLQFKPQAGNREIDDAEEGAACCPLSCTAHNTESDALLMLTATAQHRWSSLPILSREHGTQGQKFLTTLNLLLSFRIIYQGKKRIALSLFCFFA